MDKVLEYIRKHRMIEQGDQVIVGVSGGPDSVCLLFLLSGYRERLGFSLEVVHIEHGIRGKESREDAAFVENLCERMEIPFFLYEKDVPSLAKAWKCSLEEAGRRARYEALEEQAGDREKVRIAVAHNQDDLAETVLFHLARGCSLKGLAGIPPVRGRVIRPLLTLTRREIEEILRREGLSFRVDRTNLEEDYTRNRIRLSILPRLEREVNRGAGRHLVSLAGKAGRAEAYLEEEAKERAGRMLTFRENGARLDRRKLLSEKELMQEYILLYALEAVLRERRDFTEKHMEALKGLLTKQSGRSVNLPGGVSARNQGEELILEKDAGKPKKVLKERKLSVPGETGFGGFLFRTRLLPCKHELIQEKIYTKWFDYDRIKSTVSLRERRPGDYLTLGRDGMRQTLKKYFINEKIPKEERERLPLLADGSHIIWAVGRRISESYKVTEETRRVLEVEARPWNLKSTDTEE